jgi:hypothetical protein
MSHWADAFTSSARGATDWIANAARARNSIGD